MAVTHSTAARNAATDAVTLTLGANARLKFRTAGTIGAPGTQVANLAMTNNANGGFGAAATGTATAAAITSVTHTATGALVGQGAVASGLALNGTLPELVGSGGPDSESEAHEKHLKAAAKAGQRLYSKPLAALVSPKPPEPPADPAEPAAEALPPPPKPAAPKPGKPAALTHGLASVVPVAAVDPDQSEEEALLAMLLPDLLELEATPDLDEEHMILMELLEAAL